MPKNIVLQKVSEEKISPRLISGEDGRPDSTYRSGEFYQLRPESEFKWFRFNQNNSGGDWTGPAEHVWVLAKTSEEANKLAVFYGDLYFDSSQDCNCCGARWWAVSSWDGRDSIYLGAFGGRFGFSEKNVPLALIYNADKLPKVLAENAETFESN